jgi:4-hydroxythreonine-4-phosphate dehydrogenase
MTGTGRRKVGIAVGDPAGVGPEITLKAALDPRVQSVAQVVLFGDRKALEAHIAAGRLPIEVREHVSVPAEGSNGRTVDFVHVDCLAAPLTLGQVKAEHGAAALAALDAATGAALSGHLDAVVAGPIHELAIRQAGIAFDGHPSWLARRTGTAVEDVFLMLCWGDKRIAHATLHQSVRTALAALTQDRILRVIVAVDAALRRLGISAPRIGVSGVNPHAGESGLFGSEEAETIEPAVQQARARGLDVVGPIGADTLLPRTDFDAFVVMLHDQGHILAKSAAPHGAAALSVGTPIIFSSVGHGTAMGIAGKGEASPEAIVQAVLQVTNAARGQELAP